MTTTARVPNITNAAWVELSSGLANVLVDLDQAYTPEVLISIGTTNPGVGVTDGFKLSARRRSFPISGLGASDKVYARSTGGTVSLVVAKG